MYKNSLVSWLVLTLLLFASSNGNAQIGINIIAPDPNAALHIYGNREKGLLIPFMDQSDRLQFQTNHANQSNGLMVYDTLLHLYFQFTGSVWQAINPWTTNPAGAEISKTTDGDVNINSTPANQNQFIGYGTVPVGSIMMWSGNVAQFDATGMGVGNLSGWALCDSRNGTPDLQGRFVVGYDRRTTGYPEHSGAEYHSMRNQGGEKNHQLIIEETPSHNHSVSVSLSSDTHNHDYLYTPESGTRYEDGDERPLGWEATTQTSNYSHSHTATVTQNNAGGNQAHENRPPYLVLAYIMRIY